AGLVDVVVMGISTGGPQALKYLIPQLPADFPAPVAIVLHMPIGYTRLYAQKLDETAPLRVSEARAGELVQAGKVLIAPAGRHLSFVRRADGVVVSHLDARPFDTQHRPAVDVLFQSAAEVFGERVLGVVMSGMGSDGKQGAAWIKSQGGRVFTEAEETCVVYGMPRSVVEAGLSDRSIALDHMAQAIMEVV
ncbi:MAG: chemotaxis protein CheB, partial [Delftia sp.]|nr:chemotaxis protein CheB [Delftia sp.]